MSNYGVDITKTVHPIDGISPVVPDLPEPRLPDVRTIFFYESSGWETVGRLKSVFNELGRAIKEFPEARYKVSIDVSGFTPPSYESD